MNGHRFLGKSLRSLATMAAAGRVVTRRDGRRPDPATDDHLGAIRGEPRRIRGPRASRIYTEWFPPAGEGSGTVIFTHGLCLTEAVWHYQKRDLAGAGFGMVTWDLPGHGHSEALAAGELTQGMAIEALARVVEEYAEPAAGVVLVGHSLGGLVSLGYLAERQDRCRELVRGAVLASTPMTHFARAVAGGWAGAGIESRILARVLQYLIESERVDRYLGRDVGTAKDSLAYRIIRVGFGRTPSPTQVRFIRDVISSVPPQVRADAYKAMTSYDVRPLLGKIAQRVLVVIGEEDRLVNPAESEVLAERLPDGETLVLPDVGHGVFLEVPKTFNGAVRGFAERALGIDAAPEAGSA